MAKRTQNNKAKQVKEQTVLKTNIERITMLRQVRDIANWRMALMMAESLERPDRSRLYDIYNEIVDDPHLTAVMEKIMVRCTNSRIWWKVDGQRADAKHPINQLTGKSYFMDIVRFIIESAAYGHSLVQLNFLLPDFNPETTEGSELVHRPNVRPEYGDILPSQGDEGNAINYRQPPYSNFLLEVGKRRNLGWLNKAVPEVLYKKFGVIDWHEFLERYGLPIQEIQYDPNNPSNRVEAEKAVQAQGGAASIVLPIGSNYNLHDTAKAGSSDAFERNADYHNKELSKLILLGTGTTEGIGSRAQGDTHQHGEDEAVWAYQLFAEMTLNEKLKPILQRHGWQVEENGEFGYGDTERLNKSALADVLVKISAIADIPQDYVRERFNVPEPKEGDIIKDNVAQRSQAPDLDPNAKKEGQTPEKKKLMGDSVFSLSEAKPRTGFGAAVGGLQPCCEVDTYTNVSLAYNNNGVTKQETALLKTIWEGVTSTGKIPRQHFQELSSLLLSGVDEGYPSPGKDWDSPDHLRRSLLEANVQRFSAAKDLAMVQQLNEIKNAAEDFNDFKAKAQPILGNFNANWLRAEYNHAVATSQNAAAYLRHLDLADIYPFWRYKTVGDDRVRDVHAALDGMVFRIDDPEALRFYPPNGFGCRCEDEPTSEGDPQTLEDAISAIGGEAWQLMIDKGFDSNPGDTLKIFPKNMEYIRQFDPNGLNWQSFLLLSYRRMEALPKQSVKPLNSQAAARWFADRQGGHSLDSKEAVRLLDYRKRPILLEKTVVDDLVTNGKGGYLNEVEPLLSKPSEVWIEENPNGQSLIRRHINFYNDKAVIVEVLFGKGLPETILAIDSYQDDGVNNIDNLRKGILVK